MNIVFLLCAARGFGPQPQQQTSIDYTINPDDYFLDFTPNSNCIASIVGTAYSSSQRAFTGLSDTICPTIQQTSVGDQNTPFSIDVRVPTLTCLCSDCQSSQSYGTTGYFLTPDLAAKLTDEKVRLQNPKKCQRATIDPLSRRECFTSDGKFTTFKRPEEMWSADPSWAANWRTKVEDFKSGNNFLIFVPSIPPQPHVQFGVNSEFPSLHGVDAIPWTYAASNTYGWYDFPLCAPTHVVSVIITSRPDSGEVIQQLKGTRFLLWRYNGESNAEAPVFSSDLLETPPLNRADTNWESVECGGEIGGKLQLDDYRQWGCSDLTDNKQIVCRIECNGKASQLDVPEPAYYHYVTVYKRPDADRAAFIGFADIQANGEMQPSTLYNNCPFCSTTFPICNNKKCETNEQRYYSNDMSHANSRCNCVDSKIYSFPLDTTPTLTDHCTLALACPSKTYLAKFSYGMINGKSNQVKIEKIDNTDDMFTITNNLPGIAVAIPGESNEIHKNNKAWAPGISHNIIYLFRASSDSDIAFLNTATPVYVHWGDCEMLTEDEKVDNKNAMVLREITGSRANIGTRGVITEAQMNLYNNCQPGFVCRYESEEVRSGQTIRVGVANNNLKLSNKDKECILRLDIFKPQNPRRLSIYFKLENDDTQKLWSFQPVPPPTPEPTAAPPTQADATRFPTLLPTLNPTPYPTSGPIVATKSPTFTPATVPTPFPTPYPTKVPTTPGPTAKPTRIPTANGETHPPTRLPTAYHARANPTAVPTPSPDTPSSKSHTLIYVMAPASVVVLGAIVWSFW